MLMRDAKAHRPLMQVSSKLCLSASGRLPAHAAAHQQDLKSFQKRRFCISPIMSSFRSTLLSLRLAPPPCIALGNTTHPQPAPVTVLRLLLTLPVVSLENLLS